MLRAGCEVKSTGREEEELTPSSGTVDAGQSPVAVASPVDTLVALYSWSRAGSVLRTWL